MQFVVFWLTMSLGPMLMKDGILAESEGRIIGIGEGGGIGFMLVITGIIWLCWLLFLDLRKVLGEWKGGV